MAIIDLTYFTRELTIAQKSQPEVAEAINSRIVVDEPDLLKELLGVDLYAEFAAGLAATPPIDQKWVTLRDWLRDATTKVSPVANHVFVKYESANVSTITGVGFVAPVAENAERVDATPNIVKAFNQMVDLCEEVHKKILANIEDYPNYKHANQPTLQSASCLCTKEPNFFSKINRFGL